LYDGERLTRSSKPQQGCRCLPAGNTIAGSKRLIRRREGPAVKDSHVRWGTLCCASLVAACAGGPQINYESTPPDPMTTDTANDNSGDAAALEQAERDCRRDGKHAVAQRIEGETVYDCAD
jgi:hypothetical protein